MANLAYRTYISFDTKDSASLIAAMKKDGVNIGTCGTRTVRLRPMLIFEEAMSKFQVWVSVEVDRSLTRLCSPYRDCHAGEGYQEPVDTRMRYIGMVEASGHSVGCVQVSRREDQGSSGGQYRVQMNESRDKRHR